MSNLLSKLQEAIREQLPSFAVGYNFPNDPTNAKFAQSIAEAIADSVLCTLAENIDEDALRLARDKLVERFQLARSEDGLWYDDAEFLVKAYFNQLTKPQGDL